MIAWLHIIVLQSMHSTDTWLEIDLSIYLQFLEGISPDRCCNQLISIHFALSLQLISKWIGSETGSPGAAVHKVTELDMTEQLKNNMLHSRSCHAGFEGVCHPVIGWHNRWPPTGWFGNKRNGNFSLFRWQKSEVWCQQGWFLLEPLRSLFLPLS